MSAGAYFLAAFLIFQDSILFYIGCLIFFTLFIWDIARKKYWNAFGAIIGLGAGAVVFLIKQGSYSGLF